MINSREKEVIGILKQFIEENLDNSELSIEAICVFVGISRTQLHRVIKIETNLSTTLFIRKIRLEKAINLLQSTNLRISEIADAVGISNSTNFSKYFYEEFTISPTDYKKKHFLKIPTEIPNNVSQLSIAVLPFINMSNDLEQEYFSDGITEEIINLLAHVPQLKVAGRTSCFSFKNKNSDLRHIGSMLNVNHILEGSVRKSGNTLRITAQLIKVSDGFHLWSEKYDTEMNDIFKIQDEISSQILEKIKINLFGEDLQTLFKRDTQNIEAYRMYLKGLFHYNKFSGTEEFYTAITYFEKAIALDPAYASAYSSMAACYMQLSFFSQILPDKNFTKTKFAIQKALELEPNNADHFVRDGQMKMWFDWDFNGAIKSFNKAMAINPNNIQLNHYLGFFYNFTEQKDLANYHFQKCLELDPLSTLNKLGMGWNMWWQGNFDLGLAYAQNMINANPFFWAGYHLKALFLFEKFQFEGIHFYLEKSIELYPSSLTICLKAMILIFMNEPEKAKELLAHLEANEKKLPVSNHDLGQLYIALGDLDHGDYYWEKALEMHEGRMLFIHKFFRKAKFFKTHPRFQKYFEAIEQVFNYR